MVHDSRALEILDEVPFDMQVAGTNTSSIKLFVKAWGAFRTSGWQNVRLVYRVPRPGTPPSPEDFAEFDFFADPPPKGAIIVDAITPLIAVTLVDLPTIVHGVRVFGQNNSKEQFVRFDTLPPQNTTDGNDFIPIPWKVAGGGGDLGG